MPTFKESQLQYAIVKEYMEGNTDTAIDMAVNYMNNRSGKVSKDMYLLLSDLYQVSGKRAKFDTLQNHYQRKHSEILRIWEEPVKSKMVSQNNSLQLRPRLLGTEFPEIDEFEKECSRTRFGRIDFNPLRIWESDPAGLNAVLQMLYRLKDTDYIINLMGDNKVLQIQNEMEYIKNLLKGDPKEFPQWLQRLQPIMEEMEKNIMLLQLELLQWKGYIRQFSQLIEIYIEKYGEIPTDYKEKWEKSKSSASYRSGISRVYVSDTISTSSVPEEVFSLDVDEVNRQNLHYLTNYLSGNSNFAIFLDFKGIRYFTDDAARQLIAFFAHYRNEDSYDINVIHANKMIEILLKHLGVGEYLKFSVIN